MCELFYPYGHLLDAFYTSFEQMFSSEDVKKYLRSQDAVSTGFMELMENRQSIQHSKQLPLGAALKAKQGTKSEGTCPKDTTGNNGETLAQWKEEYCVGYRHLDLADETTKNIAMVYVEKDIKLEKEKYMNASTWCVERAQPPLLLGIASGRSRTRHAFPNIE